MPRRAKNRRKITDKQFDDRAAELIRFIKQNVSPFENDTPEKQAERIKRGKSDKLFFFKTYLPHYFSCSFAPFHAEWATKSDMENHVYLAVVPREHAKSTFWSFGVPIHNILYKKRMFNIIGSDTNGLATDFVLSIRVELEENKRILHDFGYLRGAPWTAGNFVTSNGVRCWARGYGEPVRGRKHRQYRPDYICLDDLENDKTVRSPKQTEGRVNWIRGAILGSMAATGLLVYAQNMFSTRSAISQMVADEDESGDQRYDSCVFSAIIDEGKATERPLWPALWPMKRLLSKINQITIKTFRKEFMNQTESDDAEFKSSLVKYYDDHFSIPENLSICSFCDPSAKNAKKNDYRAVITVGLDNKTMTVYVLHAWIKHKGITEMFDACGSAFDSYHNSGEQIGIEENMLHDFLHKSIETYAKDTGRFLPWKAVNHSSNKEARIVGTLSYIFQQGKLLFCKNHSDQNRLVEQLCYLEDPNINDDGPDALEGAVSMLYGNKGKTEYKSVGKRRTGNRRGAL